MDRQLQIALVSTALAIAWGYALQLRLRGTAPQWVPISRQGTPGLFWCLMIVLAVVEAGFVALAFISFAGWMNARS